MEKAMERGLEGRMGRLDEEGVKEAIKRIREGWMDEKKVI